MPTDLEGQPVRDDNENSEFKPELKTQPRLGGSGSPPRIATDLMDRGNSDKGPKYTHKKPKKIIHTLAGLAFGIYGAHELNDYIFQNNHLLQGIDYVVSGTLGYLSFRMMARAIF